MLDWSKRWGVELKFKELVHGILENQEIIMFY